LIQGSPNQVSLCWETAVESSFTDSGTACDRLHGGIGPQLAVYVSSGAQDAFNVAGRICPQRPVGNHGHCDSVTDS
jgi:hypothetical protein